MTRILIVDDEVTSGTMLAKLLVSEGHQVLNASTGQDAIAQGVSFKPDILICDWLLKNTMDGVDVAHALIKFAPSLGIIFITGFPAAQLAPLIDNLPVLKVFEKPVQVDELLEFINHAATQYPSLLSRTMPRQQPI